MVKCCTWLCVLLVLAIAFAGCGDNATGFGANSLVLGTSGSPGTVLPGNPDIQIATVAFIENADTVVNGAVQGWQRRATEAEKITAGTRNIYTVKNDGTGLGKTNDHPLDFHSVYILADGSKGVFAAHAPDGYSQIYLAPGGSFILPLQLTTTPIHKTSPMLSADGSKIVFVQSAPLQPDPEIWNVDIAIMDADGSNLHLVPRPADWYVSHPFLSPDSNKIALSMATGGIGGDIGVFIMDVDGTNVVRLTPGGVDGILAVAPAFSPDGKQIVFGSVGWGDVSLYTINADGSGLKRVGQKDSGWRDPLFVGNRIMFVSPYGDTEIYSMNVDGTDVMQVTSNIYEDAFEMSID